MRPGSVDNDSAIAMADPSNAGIFSSSKQRVHRVMSPFGAGTTSSFRDALVGLFLMLHTRRPLDSMERVRFTKIIQPSSYVPKFASQACQASSPRKSIKTIPFKPPNIDFIVGPADLLEGPLEL